jgi:hypothetical protein
MAIRQLTQVYLEPGQKKALQKRAKTKGTKVSEEIRNAVDAYLGGITPQELELLDFATRAAGKELAAMADTLEATNAKLDTVFAELERMRAEQEAAA